MKNLVRLAFERPRQPADRTANIDPQQVRKIVSGRAHGNVRLQHGLYYTSDDIDARFEALRGFQFAD